MKIHYFKYFIIFFKMSTILLFYWGEDSDLEVYAPRDTAKILSCLKSLPHDKQIIIHILVDTTTQGTYHYRWSSADDSSSSNDPVSVQLFPLNDIDMSKGATLEAFISACLLQEKSQITPESTVGLFMAGHGNGVTMELEQGKTTAVYTIEQSISRALERCSSFIPYKRLDFIAFEACFMASVETAYELQSVSKYIIASEDYQMNQGLTSKTLIFIMTTVKSLKDKLTDMARDFISRNNQRDDIDLFKNNLEALTDHDCADISIIDTDRIIDFAGILVARLKTIKEKIVKSLDPIDADYFRYVDIHSLLSISVPVDEYFQSAKLQKNARRQNHKGLMMILNPQSDRVESMVISKLKIAQDFNWIQLTTGWSCQNEVQSQSSGVIGIKTVKGDTPSNDRILVESGTSEQIYFGGEKRFGDASHLRGKNHPEDASTDSHIEKTSHLCDNHPEDASSINIKRSDISLEANTSISREKSISYSSEEPDIHSSEDMPSISFINNVEIPKKNVCSNSFQWIIIIVIIAIIIYGLWRFYLNYTYIVPHNHEIITV